jgi:hypothetical protein
MATSTFVVLYAGVTGAMGAWLWLAAALVGVESAVFLGNGLKCPLTAVAAKYGGGEGADTFLPEQITHYTFRVFGPLILIAAALARQGPIAVPRAYTRAPDAGRGALFGCCRGTRRAILASIAGWWSCLAAE